MAFSRPTLADLVERIQQDFVSRLELSAPILRRSLVYVFARVMAGAAHMLHGHLEYLSRQIFPDLSDSDFLQRQAALFGISRKPASYAAGNVNVTGTTSTVVPIGTGFTRADGAEYETTAEATLAGGTATVPVQARTAGVDSNAGASVSLSLESPIAGVSAAAAVAAGGLVGGSDEESDADLRVRLLERLRAPPHGGAKADYVAWAKEIAGVTRAWCFPTELGAGTVVVRFMRDDDATAIPDAGEVAAVQAHINEVSPVTAIVTVQAPVAAPLNFGIHITPDTSALRAAVTAELADLLLRVAAPNGSILRSQMELAVGRVEGLTDFVINAPTAGVTTTGGQISTLGTVTFT